ncbi:PREDICTED: uncharacterized protein LOC105950536 [Erythranthe guttata]|uniref:uncharacterized protein LOC105950536 n=1 Tax=Erythranthe guttata TaxID=4155 RepID=UPI00064D802A|nr:PREDICTED: uncharacterized protein LOC105950536 [Erythranthe guttata]|eukprot:XP_012829357.1 PREDICTED: uncharacterized protein LOC105950536 [Erythranthe guttata]
MVHGPTIADSDRSPPLPPSNRSSAAAAAAAAASFEATAPAVSITFHRIFRPIADHCPFSITSDLDYSDIVGAHPFSPTQSHLFSNPISLMKQQLMGRRNLPMCCPGSRNEVSEKLYVWMINCFGVCAV